MEQSIIRCLRIDFRILLFLDTDLFPNYGRVARLGRSVRIGGEAVSLCF
jgi:hypothetical protein